MVISTRGQRILIWTPLILLTLYGVGLVGFMDFMPPPSPTLSAQEVVGFPALDRIPIFLASNSVFPRILAIVFKAGPFAWNGLLSFWLPLTLYVGWTLALAYTMLRANRYQESTQSLSL